jgi:hypothetical protein
VRIEGMGLRLKGQFFLVRFYWSIKRILKVINLKIVEFNGSNDFFCMVVSEILKQES